MSEKPPVLPHIAEPRPPLGPNATAMHPGPGERPALGWGAIADALLKDPDALLTALTGRASGALTGRLAALAFFGTAAYGLIVGLFPGGLQLAAVPLKLAGGLLASALICWPSLYIMLCLSGARQSALQVLGLLTAALALLALLLAGFAPVAWIFTQSTRSAAFMGGLHLLLWAVSCAFALRSLGLGLQTLNGRPMRALPVWGAVFVLVCLQMTATLRPLLSPFSGWGFAPRTFFLETWCR